jgi:PAS domain S-box-containing protein
MDSVLSGRYTDYIDSSLLEKALDYSVIISVTNKEGIITYTNQHFIDISGYSFDELIGSTHSLIKHSDTSDELFKDMWQTITSKKSWRGIIKNRKKDGSSYWVKTLIMPILKDQKIDGYISVRTDITELMKIKDAQKNFHHRVIHELHNKLSSIKLSFEWIDCLDDFTKDEDRQECSSEAKKASKNIKTAYNHLERLVSDMRDISKIDMKNVKLQMDWIKVDDIIEDLMTSLGDIIEKNGNSFMLKNSAQGASIYIDDLRINQILFNIISNASKFTQNGTIVCHIKIEDNKIMFMIEDSGKGISESAKEHIFDEYWKDPLSQGFGLGLPISKGLTELMDGDIWFDSKEGSGSIFYVTFGKFRMADG